MPFEHPMRPYTRQNISSFNPNQSGVYGIFIGHLAVYIGSGDIRARMLDHINDDNPCIVSNNPNQWAAIVISGDPKPTEGELIQEYDPVCNKVVPGGEGIFLPPLPR